MKDPEAVAKQLIEMKFPIEKYEALQAHRRERLVTFKRFDVEVLIKAEQELINQGEQVLIHMRKLMHTCNEDGVVYETADGQRFYFSDPALADKWYKETKPHVTMNSVACSICESPLIDKHFKGLI